MASIDKFLGKRVEIPEDRRYYSNKDFGQSRMVKFSFLGSVSRPCLNGRPNDFEALVADGQNGPKGRICDLCYHRENSVLDAPVKALSFSIRR